MKLQVPLLNDIDLVKDWNKIKSTLEEERTMNIFITKGKSIKAIISCKSKEDKLLATSSTQYFKGNVGGKEVHCYKISPEINNARAIFNAYLERQNIKKTLGEW